MTYHITQEQAFTLLKELRETGHISEDNIDDDDLATVINTALDKVLGEPTHIVGTVWQVDEMLPVGTKLYTPKELP